MGTSFVVSYGSARNSTSRALHDAGLSGWPDPGIMDWAARYDR
jgi:hypothetical protein